MEQPFRPRGVYIPVITPFAADGSVDVEALAKVVTEYLDEGANGIVVLGTTGESTALTGAEQQLAIATCAAITRERGAELIVGAGTNSTATTIEKHEALAAIDGVHASLAVVPYYVRPSEAAIVKHYEAVAARSPVPIIAYNIPYRTGRGLGAAALLDLAAIDNVVGVKQAVGGIDADTLTVLARRPADFSVLCGDDAFFFPLALLGAEGGIAASAHLCTRHWVRMLECAVKGAVEEGRAIAEALLPLVISLFVEPSPAVLKAVLHRTGRIATPDVRMPLTNASDPAAERAVRDLERAEARS